MARKILEKVVEPNKEETFDLTTAVDNYFVINSEKQRLDKEVKAASGKIKDELLGKDLKEFITNTCKATITEKVSLEYDDIKLLEIVRTLPEDYKSRLIDTVEVVNMEKLERMIASEELRVDLFTDAEIKKVTYALNVKAIKKEEK